MAEKILCVKNSPGAHLLAYKGSLEESQLVSLTLELLNVLETVNFQVSPKNTDKENAIAENIIKLKTQLTEEISSYRANSFQPITINFFSSAASFSHLLDFILHRAGNEYAEELKRGAVI